MVLYLAAAVIGVVAIVLLVIHLAKSGGSTSAGGTPTASGTPTSSGTAGNAAATGYTFKLASSVGSYRLNRPAVNDLSAALKSPTGSMADSVHAAGVGRATKTVFGIYDLGPVSSLTSSSYKGVVFVGYDGTFSPARAIKVIRAHLAHTRVEPAGAHGGKMVCGYDTSSGSDASMCVWVTPTTLGSVQFLAGDNTVKYPGAAKLALKVRNAVEVPAS